jgi:histidine ammonia-lyase
MQLIRQRVAHYDIDHYFAPDIATIQQAVEAGLLAAHCPLQLPSDIA